MLMKLTYCTAFVRNCHLRLFSSLFTEGDADADKKEKVEDVENAEPVAS